MIKIGLASTCPAHLEGRDMDEVYKKSEGDGFGMLLHVYTLLIDRT